MPGYDGTGPQGTGPVGRGLGPCGQGGAYPRRGFFGFRRGWRGPGRGFGWSSQYSPGDERTDLDAEKSWLTQQLDAINQRLNELNKD